MAAKVAIRNRAPKTAAQYMFFLNQHVGLVLGTIRFALVLHGNGIANPTRPSQMPAIEKRNSLVL
jgi:hypothetical protein